jgi:hypothetical protein
MKPTLDFLVIGAAKSGTSSLFEYLRHHPEVALPPDKEAPYFSNDIVYARGWQDYISANFATADPALRWGTITPQYMFGTVFVRAATQVTKGDGYDERTVPQRIRELLPSVRLVAILRDPVERAWSDYHMYVMQGRETRSFAEVIDELLRPAVLERCRRQYETGERHVTCGEYGRILAGYRDIFPAEQLLVMFTADLESAPHSVLDRLYEFIGLTPGFVPPNLGRRYNVGAAAARTSRLTPNQAVRATRRIGAARALWKAIPDAGHKRALAMFARFDYRFTMWNRRGAVGPPSASDLSAGERLREHYEADASLLRSLGYPPPWAQKEVVAGGHA